MNNLPDGEITVHYFSLPIFARGGPIKALLADAGIPFKQNNYTFDDWKTTKEELLKSGKTFSGSLPILQVGDHYYSQSPAIITFLTHHLQAYRATTGEEEYQLAVIGDLTNDAIASYFRKDQEKFAHLLGAVEKALATFHGSNPRGPFALQDKITHLDFTLFCFVHDAVENKDAYPKLKALFEAVKARERLSQWLENNSPK